jgi:hypothetical protein
MQHAWARLELHTIFWLVNFNGRDHSEDLGVDGDYIRIDLREILWEVVDWAHLNQDREMV